MPGRSTRGLQSMPLAADGVLYYSGSYSRVYARRRDRQAHLVVFPPSSTMSSWQCRRTRLTIAALRLAISKVFVGTVDGRLIALDMKTGKPVWDTQLVDSKLTVGFTGAHWS